MLVSIIVATYNCEAYISEALNSVFKQTYKELELIVTDDCSKDHSVDIAKRWIETHKGRFVRIAQTQTTHNSGVTANYNAGLSEAQGIWIKCLDGDDILPDDAIETYVKYCTSKPTFSVWYANEQPFNDKGAKGIVNKTIIPQVSAQKQMIYLLNHRLLGICTATNFIHRETFVTQGGFNSRYPMYQDGSPFLQTLAEGKSIGVIDEVTLFKRENPDSLMHTANPVMTQNIRDCHYYYCRFYLQYLMPLHYYNAWLTHWLSTHDTSKYQVMIVGYILRCFDFVNIFRKLCS